MTRPDRWMIVAAAAITLAACGSEPTDTEPSASVPAVSDAALPTSPTPSTPTGDVPPPTDADADLAMSGADVCAALGDVDLDGLLAEPAGTPVPEDDPLGSGCSVPAMDPASKGTVAVWVTTESPAANYENTQDLFGVDAEIPDLGEAAFASDATVVVLTDNALTRMQVVRWSELDAGGVEQAELEAAMRQVLTTAGITAGTDGDDGETTGDSSPGDGGSAAAGSACALLELVDVDALIGEPLGAAVSEEDGSDSECEIPPLDPDSTAVVSLSVDREGGAQQFAETKEIFGVDAEVDGLGDDAFHSGPVLAVLSGDRTYLLWIMGDIMLGANVDDADMEAAMAQILEADAG
jgi:hypothetical protein